MQYYYDYCTELTDMERKDFQSFMRQYDINSVTFSEIQEINQKHIYERPNKIKYNDEEKRILKLITNVLLLRKERFTKKYLTITKLTTNTKNVELL